MNSILNQYTMELAPYPMEELRRIKNNLLDEGLRLFDFGTGDPKMPTPKFIRDALIEHVPHISQYPSILGIDALKQAHLDYLQRHLNLQPNESWDVIPSRGSKEAIFHIALSIVGRADGRKSILYPNPGYPVYKASALFAGGVPVPYNLTPDNDFLIEPWTLARDIQEDLAAVWINYPHNPTGVTVGKDYLEKMISWCHKHDVLLLCDDCYIDIYAEESTEEPLSALALSQDRVLSFMSLSKRSGMTGFRAGMIAGDQRIIAKHVRARANFGLGVPEFIQHAAIAAWNDESHVQVRRQAFSKKMKKAGKRLIEMGVLDEIPEATFYLWCKVPGDRDDVDFCLSLAKEGVVTSPSQWLGSGVKGWFRLAMVPEIGEIDEAMDILENFLKR